MVFKCTEAGCSYSGETVNQLQEHRLDTHMEWPEHDKPACPRFLGALQEAAAQRAVNGQGISH